MTVEEVVKQALAEVPELGDRFPSTRTSMYRRVGMRQRQLFAMATQINPEWAGVCATVVLAGGAADMRDVMEGDVTDVARIEHLSRLEIFDRGTSAYANGDEVTIVPSDDLNSGLAPRVIVRNWVLYGVASDLDGVAKLRVFYSRVPEMPTGAGSILELPEAHMELLVLDLVRDLLKRASSIDKLDREAQLAYFGTRESDAVELFKNHVTSFTSTVARFSSTA